VKEDESLHPCKPRQASRLPGRQVILLPGALPVFVQETGLDEQGVGAPGERHDALLVGGAVDRVGHIDDPLPRRDLDDPVPQLAQRKRPLHDPAVLPSPPCADDAPVGLVAMDAILQRVDPGPARQAHLGQGVFHDVDAPLLLQAEGQAGDLVIQEHGIHVIGVPFDDGAVEVPDPPLRLGPEGLPALEHRGLPAAGVELRHRQPEIVLIVFHEVPRVGPKLSLHVVDEAGGSVEAEALVPPEADAQQVIEADEVIHVGVGDEDPVRLEDHPGRQRPDVPQIEQQRLPAVSHVEEKGRVPEGVVDETGAEHDCLSGPPHADRALRPYGIPACPDRFLFVLWRSGAVKERRQKSLDFRGRKRFIAQLDHPFLRRKEWRKAASSSTGNAARSASCASRPARKP